MAHLSREEQAKCQIGRTYVSPAPRAAVCIFFLAVIFAYPLLQCGWEYRGLSAQAETPRLTALSPLRIFPLAAAALQSVPPAAGAWERLLAANTALNGAIKKYEDALGDASLLSAWLLQPLQEFLLRTCRLGNEKVIVGDEGWLFFADDVNYLLHPGFLNPGQLRKRTLSGVQPDPVAAVIDFQRQLSARNIELMLMPVPVKPVAGGRYLGGKAGAVHNPSFALWKEKITAAGVKVLDLTADFKDFSSSGVPLYLRTDTHWTPAGMSLAADKAAAALRPLLPALPEESRNSSPPPSRTVTARGDTAAMLKLSRPEDFIAAETVTIYPHDQAISPASPLLLLGDSFTNIFSLEAMGWGARGGFAETLARKLGQPVDVIALNDAGAHAARQILSRELRRGRDRLAGKKVVLWEFACRELAHGDWKILDMTLGEAAPGNFFTAEKKQTVRATVLAVSSVPRPGTAPYKDHLCSVHLGDLNGGGGQAVVYMVSMRDNVWQDAAQLRPGTAVTAELSPWTEAEAIYGSWNRSEFSDEELMLAEPSFGELKKE